VACGLKRGFTFVFHRPGAPFTDSALRERQLLVSASPHDQIADTHWYRPEFDHALLKDAEAAGAIYLDDTTLISVTDNGTDLTIRGERQGSALEVAAPFVIDASGPRGFLARHLGLERAPHWLPGTQGLYTHFRDVALWEDVAPPAGVPPHPPDAAALHHVFPGGWIWVLRFDNGITSAGAALTDPLAATVRPAEGAAAWDRLLDMLPSVQAQFGAAQPTRPFIHTPRVAFRSTQVVGERWALLPSAAGVIDPLLSTGFPLTLLGVLRLLEVMETTSPGPARQRALADYEVETQAELDVTEQLVAALYANMATPDLFRRLSLLYFAAASFSETVRRLGRPDRAPGFLLHRHPIFGPELRACAALAATAPHGQARADLFARIDRAIEPFDAAGLLDDSRRGWYPVLRDDLVRGAAKLHASETEIQTLLARSGL
jgi:FADH2 O2-dependent halogenase